MTTIIGRLVRRIEHWLDLLIIPDDRFVCRGCADRFVSRSLGVEHVRRCHPEYQGVMVYEESVEDPAPPSPELLLSPRHRSSIPSAQKPPLGAEATV